MARKKKEVPLPTTPEVQSAAPADENAARIAGEALVSRLIAEAEAEAAAELDNTTVEEAPEVAEVVVETSILDTSAYTVTDLTHVPVEDTPLTPLGSERGVFYDLLPGIQRVDY